MSDALAFTPPDYGRFTRTLVNAVPFEGATVAVIDGRVPCGADMLAVSEVEDDGQERFLKLFELLTGQKRDLLFATHAADYAGVLSDLRDYFMPADTASAPVPGPGTAVAGVADWGRRSLPLSAAVTIGGVATAAIPFRVPSGGDMFRMAKRADVGHRRLLALAVNLAELELDFFLALPARDYAAVLREMAGFFTPARQTQQQGLAPAATSNGRG